uniref:HCP-like protein n=1 Tax=Rhizophagus irregularis (strain DAOM 181602 / DAOM 197198 / MUCL 43194) TaxID=747089 RepID=U9UNV8_RHIID
MTTLQEIYIWLLNNQNNSNSLCLLGYFNYHGLEIELDKQIAIELYQKAAESENRLAQSNLANEYIYGKKNYNLAFKLSKKLAGNYAYGMNNLGFCYEKGIGTNYDEEKAFELYQKAANLGNFDAINNLGWCNYEGIGTDINEEKTFELYQKAANLGNLNGTCNLGWYYCEGIGTEACIDQAVYWYKKSAAQGHQNSNL